MRLEELRKDVLAKADGYGQRGACALLEGRRAARRCEGRRPSSSWQYIKAVSCDEEL